MAAEPAAPEKTAEEIEEERLWGEVDQAWAADFYEAVETAVRSRSPAPQAAQAG